MSKYVDDIAAFIGGEFLTMLVTYNYVIEIDFLHPILKIMIWFSAGLIGAVGSLVGKKITEWIGRKYFKRFWNTEG